MSRTCADFKIGMAVRIDTQGLLRWRAVGVPYNPENTKGVIVNISPEAHIGSKITVKWANGTMNMYEPAELISATESITLIAFMAI